MARIDTFEVGKTYLYRGHPFAWQAEVFGQFLGIVTEREDYYTSYGSKKWRNVRKARLRQAGVILDGRAHEGMGRGYDENEDRVVLFDLPSEVDEHVVLPRYVEGEFDPRAYNEAQDQREARRQAAYKAFELEVKERLVPALKTTIDLVGKESLPWDMQRLDCADPASLLLAGYSGVSELRLLANIFDAIETLLQNDQPIPSNKEA